MNIVVAQVGIDVSKLELVVSIDGAKPFKVANTLEFCRDLAGQLPKPCCVHLESSGSYERTVRRALIEAGVEVRVHNPLKTKRLAQARGANAKTDSIDARGLAGSGALLPERSAKSLERQRLADFSRAIQSVKETSAEYKRRLSCPELDEDARLVYENLVQLLRAKVENLERQFVTRMKNSTFAREYEIIKSVPGIGPVTARILVCELPEDVPERSPAQISSYAGLAPLDDSSGKRNGPRHLGQGNRRLKACLYMASFCVVRTQSWAKDLYARMRAKGKVHQSAMAAVMRRLLVRVVAVLKRGSPWQGEPLTT